MCRFRHCLTVKVREKHNDVYQASSLSDPLHLKVIHNLGVEDLLQSIAQCTEHSCQFHW